MSVNTSVLEGPPVTDEDVLAELRVWMEAQQQGLHEIMFMAEQRIVVALASRQWERVRTHARERTSLERARLEADPTSTSGPVPTAWG